MTHSEDVRSMVGIQSWRGIGCTQPMFMRKTTGQLVANFVKKIVTNTMMIFGMTFIEADNNFLDAI